MKKLFLIHILILFTTILFLMKVPQYTNTLLLLNKNVQIWRYYPVYSSDEANFVLEINNLKDYLYVKELGKINDTWVGNTYDYKEAYKKNSNFKWSENDDYYNKTNYDEEKREKEYNKNTGYFLINNEREIYGLSEKEIKKILNISSLKLKNPEKYMKKYGERPYLTKTYQELFSKSLNISSAYISDEYGPEEFEKGNPATTIQVNKLIFLRNIIIGCLGINLILCIAFLFKKNLENLKEYIWYKKMRIRFLVLIDFFMLFLYIIWAIFGSLAEKIKISEFIFFYIVIKNFMLYYYLKVKISKFLFLTMINILILIPLIFIKNVVHIRVDILCYYFIYLLSIFSFPFVSYRKKEKLESIVLIISSYLYKQYIYFAIVFLWLYIIF